MCASISSANEDEIINTLLNFKYEVMQYMCSRAVFGIRFFSSFISRLFIWEKFVHIHWTTPNKNRFINKHIEFGCESCTHSACFIAFGIVCASISFNSLNGTFRLSRSQLNWSHTTQETKLNTKISAFNQYDQDKMVGIDEMIVSELYTHTHTRNHSNERHWREKIRLSITMALKMTFGGNRKWKRFYKWLKMNQNHCFGSEKWQRTFISEWTRRQHIRPIKS